MSSKSLKMKFSFPEKLGTHLDLSISSSVMKGSVSTKALKVYIGTILMK